jgi:hypothetical protein
MQTTQHVLVDEPEIILTREQDYQTSLLGVVQKFQNSQWLAPLHQREPVWDDNKIRLWVKRISRRDCQPIGVIVTYQLKNGQDSPTFINDGIQRVTATSKFLGNPEYYGEMSTEKANKIVDAYQISVQHRHYASHDDAMQDFQLINAGTALTPYEMCKGVLANLPSYKLIWEPITDSLHTQFDLASSRLTVPKQSRNDRHKQYRVNFAHFVRFLARAKDVSAYTGAASERIDISDISNKRVIEWHLRQQFEKMGDGKIKAEMELFFGLVHRETALLETLWARVNGEEQTISGTLYHWIIDVAIWKRNNGLEYPRWQEFVERLLRNTNGTSVITVPKDRPVTLQQTNLGRLVKVCQILESDLYLGKPGRPTGRKLRKGYDRSHIQPFVFNGDGPTVSEPAGANRSRGAHPIQEEID